MNPALTPSDAPAARGFRRVAPAFVLFFMSPFVAEFLLGDFSIDAIWLLVVVAPMYGGGALVVREVTRRLGRGWPTMMLLALAYGIFEEGIVIQTLFNPNYLGLHLLREAYVPALGIGGWWTVFVLTLHTVWSISVPIALVEGMFAERRTTPWLGKLGVSISAVLCVAGGILVRGGTRKQDAFTASSVQQFATWVILAIVVILALSARRRARVRPGSVPTTWLIGTITFVLGLGLMTAQSLVHGWALVSADAGIDLIGAALMLTWSRRGGWTTLHTLAAAGGAMLTYACMGFPQAPVVGSKGAIDLVGNAIFAALAVTLFVLALRKEQRLAALPMQSDLSATTG